MVRGQPRVHKLWRLKHLVVKAWDNPIVDKITVGSRLAQSPNDLATRLSAGECEACGDTDGPFEMHHPNRLKDKPRDQMKPWKRSEEHTSELQSLMRISYAVFCLKKNKNHTQHYQITQS